MLDKLKTYIKDGLKEGFSLPLAKDGVTGLPSATLGFAYVSFVLAIASVAYFMAKDASLAATSTAITLWVIAMVFYRMNKIDKFKVDLDDRSVELEGDDDESTKNGN